MSRIERGGIERTQIDTLRRYIEALGGSLHVEVELEGQRFQNAQGFAKNGGHPVTTGP